MMFIWLIIAVVIIWLFKDKLNLKPSANNSALDILRERYAKGEINKEEFETKKQDLTK
ncbi:MAG: SHOCT domain-containing protein [Candidatus Komeilibacteria bacterium]|nr:SHOCT domain-containing protein [Candidatus Komeilibacteria bacterium]